MGPRVTEDFAATGIRSPDRTVCSDSLYGLRYLGPTPKHVSVSNMHFHHVLLQVYITVSFPFGVTLLARVASVSCV